MCSRRKPLADSMANARAMIAVAERENRILAVIQNRRYDPNIRRLRHLVETDAVGPLTTVNCDFYLGAHFGGFRDHMAHVLLLDMAIHTFEQRDSSPVQTPSRCTAKSGILPAPGTIAMPLPWRSLR